MDEIKMIYSNESYENFLSYCELHNYKTMRDLLDCPFDELSNLIDITPALVGRIRTIFVLYTKKHPDTMKRPRPTKAKSKAKAAPTVDMEELKENLLAFFKQNTNKLIHISDIAKAVGSGVKRTDIIHVLERQKWCQIVDSTTFFYSPIE